ncbi:hypothetical protein QBC47DRAFT_464421 [Echria macrotheca]|uniref:Uncharacterized protein n=1 Tax=Echria macrotheca TaxID=438768 RepID=A0AAJ0B7H8_9PEZI|nr:hypothetical protein QBC47DRAFT_464421 [Echria macrotheca]
MGSQLELTDIKNKLEDLSGVELSPGENPYEALINVCQGRPAEIQSLYSVHRTARNAQQRDKFLSSDFTELIIDPFLLRLEDPTIEPGFYDPRNCLVFWARPPNHIVKLAAHLQNLLKDAAPRLTGFRVLDLWLMPIHRMHLTTLEIAFARTSEEIEDLVSQIRPGLPALTNLTFNCRSRLVKPWISYDLSAFALSFLPAAGETLLTPGPIQPPSKQGAKLGSAEADGYTYHHLRRDAFGIVQDAGVQVGSRYVVPSAHITLGRYLTQDDHATPELRRHWIRTIDTINKWLEDEVWDVSDGDFVGEWITDVSAVPPQTAPSLGGVLCSLLPLDMEGRYEGGAPNSAPPPLPSRPVQSTPLPPLAESPPPRGMERVSTSNLRTAFRPGVNLQSTVRAVTPEPADVARDAMERAASQAPHSFGTVSPQMSPRTIPTGGAAANIGLPGSLPTRRQGLPLADSFSPSLDSASSSPLPRPPPFRPRTRTMDGAFRQQFASALEHRQRVGSFSSPGSHTATDDLRLPSLQPPSLELHRPSDLQPSAAVPLTKERKTSNTRSRLTKRPSSRPTSPLLSPSPSIDSLPLPIPTNDANKVLLLMKNLCGRMRGEVEYQREPGGPWVSGICYIEDEKGSLMFDSGENGPFHAPLISDLRGCRVCPVDTMDKSQGCLEISSPHLNVTLNLRPQLGGEMDLWLAAFLCWQQLRPANTRHAAVRAVQSGGPARAEVRRRVSSPGLREASIIKVGKVHLWDKGVATSPKAVGRKPPARDLRPSYTSWRRVSCILQDNGQLKLMTENDVTLLSVIELPQLARSAIQQLDRTVLDEEYCIAIFPTYASKATQLSLLRPIYISLESRVLFEVWFVLLRAFTVPDIYGLGPGDGGSLYELADLTAKPDGEVFRVEKTISVRVTEAKIRPPTLGSESAFVERHSRGYTAGNYLAEVILDGEVRARTTTKMDTKNPFWREDCEFTDLPAALPYLSVLLKRVDSSPESFTHQLQATLGMPKPGSLTEILCGSVDIPLHHLDRGKDHEQWLHVYDDRQQSIGTMLLKVRHDELVVLLSEHYKPLSELLHRFSAGLTAQISSALPGNLRRVAEIFINIFQVSGKATDWLMNMIEDEIDGIGSQSTTRKPRFSRRLKSNDSMESTSDREQIVRDMGKSLQGEANLLFRGNSLLTQALEFHMRRLGKEYLEDTLADKIIEINDTNPNCEVDPGKLQHGDDLDQHWDLLIGFTTQIWESITASAARLPPELRHILKYIRAAAEDRYGDFLRTLFGLLRDHPQPRAQRTLTLIAKGLQALVNLSTIGKKETWMEPMNRFIGTQRQSVKDFLDAVCSIPAERVNISVPASYSTPITIQGRLSPMAREGFPSLPYLVDHARNFAALVKLWTDVHPDSATESQNFDGDLLTFHTLCAGLQKRSMECYARIESLRLAETASQMTEDQMALTDALDRLSVADTLNMSRSSPIIRSEAELRPPGSSGSEMEAHSPFGSSRESRHAHEPRSSRQVSMGSDHRSNHGGTVRGLRNGMHPRKFLSGFIRKTRTASPDASSPVARDRDRDHEKEYERERVSERIRDPSRNFGHSE